MEQSVAIRYMDIVLRDYCEADIDDEIRWMNVETAWMKTDTPWEVYPPVDEAELRGHMMARINDMSPDAVRGRLEIEKNGQHIGFVCSYFLSEDFESLDYDEMLAPTIALRTLGIEICEPQYWGQGIGSKALSAFIDYYRSIGETTFLLETWSGNSRMIKCAEKLGFVICQRKSDVHIIDGKTYDALILKLG